MGRYLKKLVTSYLLKWFFFLETASTYTANLLKSLHNQLYETKNGAEQKAISHYPNNYQPCNLCKQLTAEITYYCSLLSYAK